MQESKPPESGEAKSRSLAGAKSRSRSGRDLPGDLREKLRELYHDASKHSVYQNVPAFVREELGYTETIDEEWRGDTARYRYILGELEFSGGLVVGDVGANTGFFTLSLAHTFPDSYFIAYEGNSNHVEFMNIIIQAFGLDNVRVQQGMIDLPGLDRLDRHDVMLHLNVLHHAGHDFDAGLVREVDDWPRYASEYLRKLRAKTSRLAFQMGSNWGGNKATPIVRREDDCGKVVLLSRLFLEAGWQIVRIALATKAESQSVGAGSPRPRPSGAEKRTTVYKNLPDSLVDELARSVNRRVPKCRGGVSPPTPFRGRVPKRFRDRADADLAACVREYTLDQFPGEFYRRPIFLCESGRLEFR